MPTWPIELPQLPFGGVTAQDDDSVLRTPMDSGPPTRRNRFTAHTQKVTCPMVLTGAERTAFDFFYRSTLSNGALAFDWIDPVDDSVVSMAFTSPTQWALIAGGADAAERGWSGVLSLQVQP
jgi:hypothetical protein